MSVDLFLSLSFVLCLIGIGVLWFNASTITPLIKTHSCVSAELLKVIIQKIIQNIPFAVVVIVVELIYWRFSGFLVCSSFFATNYTCKHFNNNNNNGKYYFCNKERERERKLCHIPLNFNRNARMSCNFCKHMCV